MMPKTYEEWLLNQGEQNEIGLKCLITYQILRDRRKEVFDSMFNITKEAFEKTLFDKGHKPVAITFEREDDPTIRAREIIAIIDAQQGASLEEFAGVIYAQARDFYNQVQNWETKSLWQYIKWVFKRRFKRSIKQCPI